MLSMKQNLISSSSGSHASMHLFSVLFGMGGGIEIDFFFFFINNYTRKAIQEKHKNTKELHTGLLQWMN
jgi:hypothetical protein